MLGRTSSRYLCFSTSTSKGQTSDSIDQHIEHVINEQLIIDLTQITEKNHTHFSHSSPNLHGHSFHPFTDFPSVVSLSQKALEQSLLTPLMGKEMRLGLSGVT